MGQLARTAALTTRWGRSRDTRAERSADAFRPRGCLYAVENLGPELLELWDQLHSVARGPSAFTQGCSFAAMIADISSDAPFELFCLAGAGSQAPALVPLRRGDIDLKFLVFQHPIADLRLRGVTVVGTEPLSLDGSERGADAAAALLDFDREASCFEFAEVAKDSPLWRRLNAPDVRKRFDLHVVDGFRSWQSTVVPASLEEYGRALGKKKRYNLRRQERLLQSKLSAPLELVIVEHLDSISIVFDALDQIAIDPDEDRDLRREYYTRSAAHHLMKAYVLRAGDRYIGVVLASFLRDTLYVHSLHHDVGLAAYSPGTALWQRVMRHLIREGQFTRVIFGYGEPAHRFSTNSVELRGRAILTRKGTSQYAHIFPYLAFSYLKRQAERVRVMLRAGARRFGAIPARLGRTFGGAEAKKPSRPARGRKSLRTTRRAAGARSSPDSD